MGESIIIGIHGLLNKPPKDTLEEWWKESIQEGLMRNHSQGDLQFDFQLAYWADVRNPNPIPLADLDEKYEKAQGQGPLQRYDPKLLDKVRAITQKFGGRLIDKAKDLTGIGKGAEKILAITLEDLSDYYKKEDIRNNIRTRLSSLLENHKNKRILLIAHSMGSIIAYDVLRAFDFKINHFITIGSPLGLPYVSKKIRNEFQDNQTPGGADQWTNISDPGDKVALDCNLNDEYDPNANGVKVNDVLICNEYVNHENKKNNHKSYGYLRAPEVSDRILEFLKTS